MHHGRTSNAQEALESTVDIDGGGAIGKVMSAQGSTVVTNCVTEVVSDPMEV